MAQKYTVPFYIDESLEDIIAEDESLTKEELLEINKKTNIKTFLIGESLLKNLEKNSIFSVL